MSTTHIKTVTFIVGVLVGISIGYKFLYASEVAVAAFVLALFQGGLYLVQRKKMSGAVGANHLASRIPLSIFTFLFSFGVSVGIIRVQLVEDHQVYLCQESCVFTGVVTSQIETKNEYQIFNVHPVTLMSDTYDVQVRVPLYPRYQIGETLTLAGKVTAPKIIAPHDGKKVFDYTSYLATQNVGSEMYYPHVEVVDQEAHDISSYLGRLKQNLVERINLYVSAPSSSLATGMLFGNSSMSAELLQIFRTAGLSHIIVLSGFNIAVVIAFVLFVFSFLPLVVRIIFASMVVMLFVLMVGGEASVIRAMLMAFVSLLAMVIGRRYVAHQALVLSLFAIVMYEPQSLLFDASLHLSFLATAGIVYLVPILELYTAFIKVKALRELFVTTTAAYIATLPYIMYTFGTISTYALVANILVLPFVSPAMLISFVVMVMSFMSETISIIVGYIDTLLIGFIIFVARVVSELAFSSISISITQYEMFFLYTALIIGALWFSYKKRNETHVTELSIQNKEFLTDIIKY